jgi:hypothetical protein
MTAVARYLPRCRRQLATALHEAGHALIALAIAAPVRSAAAKLDAGSVHLDPRDHAATPSPPSRAMRLASALANAAIYLGGNCACRLRLRSRAFAIGYESARLSDEDRAGATEMVGELVACNVPYVAAWQTAYRFTEGILTHHSKPLARLALELARRGEMTGTEIAEIVPEVPVCGKTLQLLGEAVRDLLERYPPPAGHDIEEVRT